MNTTNPDNSDAMPNMATSVDDDTLNPDEYQTDSGVIVDISDVEVDVVPTEDGEIVSSQADPEAYGIDPVDDPDDAPA